jgi:hypothetical protein
MFAQALIERGMLESASLGIANFITGVGDVVQAQPYLTIAVVVVAGLLLVRRR